MLHKQKQITTRVKETDELIEKYDTTVSWVQSNKKLLSNVGTGLVIVALAITFYVNNVRSNNESAMNDFSKVFQYYDNGQYQLAINGVPEKNIRGLQSIVDEYGSSEYGNIAKVYLANSYFNQGEVDKALALYEDVDVTAKVLQVSAIAGEAACFEIKGKYEEAAQYFEKAGKKNPDDPNAAENLAHAARNYAKAGKKEQAIELYRLIKKEYATSAVSREAERYLEELKG
jgi:TolA-binding protein